MIIIKLIFWVSLFIVFYSYVGYGILLWLWLKLKSRLSSTQSPNYHASFEPRVTLIVAVYNEEDFIEEKIKNSLELDYPSEKIEFLFIADGSSDKSVDLIKKHPRIRLLFQPERQGKVVAINRAMNFVNNEYVIFSDANTLLNKEAVRMILRHYQDPRVGAVAGEKKVIQIQGTKNTAGAGEGLYWKYESFLKKLDAQFYTVVGAAGELFSIRTSLFEPTAKNILLDDFIISMKICSKGFRVMYEPGAYASESPSFSMKDEQKRKIRISAGGFQSVVILKHLLNIFKYGKLSFQYISHRVLRWIICPVLLPVILILNYFLIDISQYSIYYALFILQVIFYIMASIGGIFANMNIKLKVFYIPYYFVFMNVALYLGFIRFIKNTQSVLWEKANRQM